jgi:hypothetical protein
MYRRSEKIVYRADATHFRRKFCERVFQQLQALALIDHHYGSRSEAFRSISSSIFRAAVFLDQSIFVRPRHLDLWPGSMHGHNLVDTARDFG